MPPFLSVERVSKSYPGLPVLKEASFEVAPGEIICLLGPSGCGKTTLLRIVAGLEAPDTGSVLLEGRELRDVPVHRRGFGFMFQDYALFPHMDVARNVAFGLRMQGAPADQIPGRVSEMLRMVALDGYEKRRVIELSGGEQQRVALARSLAPRPRLLMLDEPLGALDRALREQLMNDLRAILKRVGVTALYVTHDQEEAFAIADRVLIMRARPERGEGGWIEQAGTPAEVYRRPQTEYVARFLGFRNLLSGRVIDRDGGYRVETAVGPLRTSDEHGGFQEGDAATVLIRPEAGNVCATAGGQINRLAGKLLSASFRGSYYLIQTEHAGGTLLTSEVSASDVDLPPLGEPLTLLLDPAAVTLVRPERRDSERTFGAI
jgi:ABC-type Fe3+/spermidine/putrescine transport system ATPase subunit